MKQRDSGKVNSANWVWAFGAGCLTLLLSAVAFFLPEFDSLPKGGLVGWLLVLAGLPELLYGWKRQPDLIARAALGSGFITTAAGLVFISNPMLGYFPVANIVLVWLLVRGAWVFATGLRARNFHLGPWILVSGTADIVLGLALLVGLQFSTLVIMLFGPTPEVVAKFAFILSASFFFTGISQLAIASAVRNGRSH